MSNRTRLESAVERIRWSRLFTQSFLADLSADDWFWSPPSVTTHIAWQVSHVAVAQYHTCLARVRGRTAADESLISDAFIEAFKIGSQPASGTANNPPLEEIRRVFDGVYERALTELAERDDAALDVPLDQPHRVFKTKLAAVEFSSQHELVHAGQIAMLRRLLGRPPLR